MHIYAPTFNIITLSVRDILYENGVHSAACKLTHVADCTSDSTIFEEITGRPHLSTTSNYRANIIYTGRTSIIFCSRL